MQVDEFVKTPKVQSLIHQLVRLKAGRWHKHPQQNFKFDKSAVPQTVNPISEQSLAQKQKEIQIDQAALSARIKEMIDSSMIFSQLKQQPTKLLQRKRELEEQEEQIRAQLQNLDENYQVTMKYIKSEESIIRMNQDHIHQLDNKIKESVKSLQKMKDHYK